jgi:hypothetical protein
MRHVLPLEGESGDDSGAVPAPLKLSVSQEWRVFAARKALDQA